MIIYYYKVLDLNDNLIGYANSYSLRYYNEISKIILNCTEKLGQYVCVNDIFYRVKWLQKESLELEGKYPEAKMFLVSKEEYEKAIADEK